MTRDSLRQWISFLKPFKSASVSQRQATKSANGDDQLPFNALELTLFAQNCFFQIFAEDKDDNRLEMLFSVAIIILLYFVIMQTFFQGRKSQSSETPKSTFDQMISDHLQSTCDTLTKSQLFLNQIEDIYEIQQEKHRKKTNSLPDEVGAKREETLAALAHSEEQVQQAACKTLRELMQKQQRQETPTGKYATRGSGGSSDQLLIVVLLQHLKRMGEAILRWSFFTLNMFILTLSICSPPMPPQCINAAGQPVQCPFKAD
jgi:hypothetical protein